MWWELSGFTILTTHIQHMVVLIIFFTLYIPSLGLYLITESLYWIHSTAFIQLPLPPLNSWIRPSYRLVSRLLLLDQVLVLRPVICGQFFKVTLFKYWKRWRETGTHWKRMWAWQTLWSSQKQTLYFALIIDHIGKLTEK